MKPYHEPREELHDPRMQGEVPHPPQGTLPVAHLEEVAYNWNNALLLAMQNMWTVPGSRQ